MNQTDAATKLVKPLRSGQITIPVEFRKRLGITEESVLEISITAGELRVRVVEVRRPDTRSQWLQDLYALYAPARSEAIERDYTEEEVNAAISEALNAVRDEHA